jgi:hypothetical protein
MSKRTAKMLQARRRARAAEIDSLSFPSWRAAYEISLIGHALEIGSSPSQILAGWADVATSREHSKELLDQLEVAPDTRLSLAGYNKWENQGGGIAAKRQVAVAYWLDITVAELVAANAEPGMPMSETLAAQILAPTGETHESVAELRSQIEEMWQDVQAAARNLGGPETVPQIVSTVTGLVKDVAAFNQRLEELHNEFAAVVAKMQAQANLPPARQGHHRIAS